MQTGLLELLDPQDSSSSVHVSVKPPHQNADRDDIKPQKQMYSIPPSLVTAIKPPHQDVNSVNHQTEMTSMLSKLINLQCSASLPTPDMEIFDEHDITSFPIFLKTFKLVVENNSGDPARRLEALLKYTRGEANDLIKDCILIDSSTDAYNRAMYLLKSNYGNCALLAMAYQKKVETWTKMHSVFLTGLLTVKQGTEHQSCKHWMDLIF